MQSSKDKNLLILRNIDDIFDLPQNKDVDLDNVPRDENGFAYINIHKKTQTEQNHSEQYRIIEDHKQIDYIIRNGKADFSNCIFITDFNIEKISIDLSLSGAIKHINFTNSVFLNKFYIKNLNNIGLDCTCTIFKNEFIIENSNLGLIADYSLILEDAKFKHAAKFEKIKFHSTADFSGSLLHNASFSGVHFENGARFLAVKFSGRIVFTNSLFKNHVNFNGAYLDTSILNTHLHFDNVEFHDLQFDNVTFKEKDGYYISIQFINSRFMNNVSFSSSKLGTHFVLKNNEFSENANINFDGTQLKKAYISGSKIKCPMNFNYLILKEKLLIKDVDFFKKVYVSLILASKKTIFQILNSTFNSEFYFYVSKEYGYPNKKIYSNIESLQLIIKDSVLLPDKFFTSDNLIDYLSDNTPHHTFNFLKHSALIKHNNISALKFHSREYNSYLKDISNENKYTIDKLILYFEKKFSDFGTNPLPALFAWFVSLLIFGSIILVIILSNIDSASITCDMFRNIVRFAYSPMSIFNNEFNFLNKINGFAEVIVHIINYIKIIMLAFLTYEITKSLRKFSKKW